MKGKDERYPDYPLFKGLQRPLEFLGIQGRYIYWAAVTTCGAIVGFVAAYCLLGFIAGLVVLATVVSVGIVLILSGRHARGVPIPFGPFLAIAGWVSLLWGQPINDAYLRLTGLA